LGRQRGENFQALAEGLTGLWEEFAPLREIIKVLCQKDIKDIEGIPALSKGWLELQ